MSAPKQIDAEQGADLNKVVNLRLLADYEGSPIGAISQPAFVAAIKEKFS